MTTTVASPTWREAMSGCPATLSMDVIRQSREESGEPVEWLIAADSHSSEPLMVLSP